MSTGTLVAALGTRLTAIQRIPGLLAGLAVASGTMFCSVVLGLPRVHAPSYLP